MNKQMRDDLRMCINSGLQYDGGVVLQLLDYVDQQEMEIIHLKESARELASTKQAGIDPRWVEGGK